MAQSLAAESAKAAADAASIIQAHAVLDATLYKLCCDSAKFALELWLPFVLEKKVSIRDLQSSSIEDLQRKTLQVHLEQLERESLLAKCDVLFKVLKPKTVRRVLPGYSYSRERLVALDQLRHDMVHKLQFIASPVRPRLN